MDAQNTMQVSTADLPKHLSRVVKLVASYDTVDARLVADKLDIDRARASGYLNQLERLGFVKRFRHKREVHFFLVRNLEKHPRRSRKEVSLEAIKKHFGDGRFWLKSIQNDDGGWGKFKGDRSHVVNTSESILALLLMGEPRESVVINTGQRFIKRTLQNLNMQSKTEQDTAAEIEYARSYALMGLALSNSYDEVSTSSPDDIRIVVSWLQRNQDEEGYWDSRSIYSTAIAMQFLALFDDKNIETRVKLARDWLLESFDYVEGGWGRKPGSELHLAVTARVIFVLNRIGCEDERILLARDRLFRETDNWGGVMDEIFEPHSSRPLLWEHFPLACILSALLSVGENPKSRAILTGIQMLLELQDASGGWRIVKGETPRTWAMLNAAMALDIFLCKAYRESASLPEYIC